MDSICRSGLNPKKRGAKHGQMGGRGEYFGREVEVSAPYAHTQGSRKMLVFAILMDRSGLTSTDQGHPGEVVINKSDHQLPMAVVTFDQVPIANWQLGPAFGAQVRALGGGVPGVAGEQQDERFPGQGRSLGGR